MRPNGFIRQISLLWISICVLFAGSEVCLSQSVRHFTFRINDNNRPMDFGFTPIGIGGPGIGPISIAITEKFAYILDAYYDNIKKVDLSNGRIVGITSQGRSGYLRGYSDVVCTGRYLLALANIGYLYVFSSDLDMIDSLRVPVEVGSHNYFCWSHGDSLFAVTEMPLRRYKVVMHGKFPSLVDSGNVQDPASWDTTAHDKYYRTGAGRDSMMFTNSFVTLALPVPLPMISDYVAINLDFDSSRLVFFDVSRKRLDLYEIIYATR